MARELADHLLDGLAEGRSPAELRERFGDPELAATLIGRSRAGVASRALRLTIRAAAAAALVLVGLYAASAVQLGSEAPARPSGDRVVEGLASVADLERAARAHLETYRRELVAGADEQAGRALGLAVAVSDALLRRDDFFARLAGAALRMEVAEAGNVEGVIAPSAAAGGDAELRTPGAALDLEELSHWLDDFLSRVYSGAGDGGRLTAEGLRVARALKGGRGDPMGAMLLEPLYFVRPAPEAEVRAEAARLLALAREARGPGGEAALIEMEARLQELKDGDRGGLHGTRYYPLVMAMSRVPGALAAERLAR